MNVGQAVFRAIADFSSLRGESRKTARQLDADAKQMNRSYTGASGFGSGFSRVFSRISSDSGKAADSSSADAAKMGTAWGGVSTALTRVQKSLKDSAAGGKAAADQMAASAKKSEAAITSAGIAVERARKREADAAGQLAVAERRLGDARAKHAADSSQVIAAEERVAVAHRRVSEAQDNTTRSTERLEAANRTASAGITRESERTSTSLHQMARDVEASGTRGGRAFTQAFIGVVGGLSVITPAAGAAGAALIAGAGNVLTFASSLTQLGGIAALIPAGIIAVGAAVGVMKTVFSGVGTALKESTKAQEQSGASARANAVAIEDASRGIQRAEQNAASAREAAQRRLTSALQKARDVQADSAQRVADAEQAAAEDRIQSDRRIQSARKSLASAIQDAATRQAAAVKRVADAERDVERANRRVTESQMDLNQARADAVKRVRDLSRSLEGAGLSEREAAFNYRDAQEAFAKGASEGASGDEMARLRLDVDQAAFALREAKDRTAELTEEQRTAAAQGVNGNKQVIAAEQTLADARQASADAVAQRGEAVRGVAEAEAEGAERIAEAQRGVTDAVAEGARSQAKAQQEIAAAVAEGARSQADAAQAVAEARENVADVELSTAEAVADAYRNLANVQAQQAEAAAKGGAKSAEALAKLSPAARVAVGALLSVYDRLGAVRAIAQENFFAGFGGPLTALADTVIPQLLTGVGAIATEMGRGAQILMTALSGALGGGVLESLLMGVATSVRILTGAITPLVQSFVTLGTVGMTYMPRLAQAITDASVRFNNFIQTNAANGNLFVWIDNAIQAWKDLFSIVGSVIGIFGALTRAAEMGGAVSSLGGLADALNRIETIMNGPVFQTTMAKIFEGAAAGSRGLLAALGPIGDAFVRGAPAFAEWLRLGGEIAGLFVGGIFTALSDPSFGAGLVTFMEGLLAGVKAIVPLLPGLTAGFGAYLAAMAPLVQVLGPSLVEVFTSFATSIATVLRIFSPLLSAIAGSPAILGTLIAAFVATKAASAALTAAGNLQVIGLGAWNTAMFLLGKTAGGGLPAMLGKAGVAFRALGAAMSANPIGAVIAAIALLVAGLTFFFTKTELGKKLWAQFMADFQTLASGLSSWFTGTFIPALSGAWSAIQAAWSGAVQWFKDLWSGISGGGTTAVSGVKGAFSGVGAFFSGVVDAIKAPFVSGWEAVKSGASSVSGWFSGTFVPGLTGVLRTLGAPVLWLYQTIFKPTFDSIMVIARGLWMGISGVFNLFIAFLRQIVGPGIALLYSTYVKPVFDRISSIITTVINAVSAFLAQRLANIQRNWGIIWTAVSSTLARIWDGISSKVQAVLNWVASWIGSKLSALRNTWALIWTAVSSKVAQIWDGISSKIQSVFNWVTSWIGQKLGILKTAWSVAWSWIRDRASQIWDEFKNRITNTYNRYIKPLFDALGDFITKTLPNRFQTGIDTIGRIWNQLRELARKPIAFVINDVINRGLIGNFNKIADKLKVTRLPDVAMPFGLATGGPVPGHSPHPTADNVPIMATAGEYMIRHAASQKLQRRHPGALDFINRTGEIPRGYATGGEVAGEAAFFHGNANAIRPHGAYYLDVAAGLEPWNFKGAASLWDGASGIKVKTGRGALQGRATPLERGGGILGYTVGNNIDMSPSWMGQLGATQRRTVAAHEMGHAMGLPHTYRQSIMQPNLGQMASIPSAFDIRNLQALFPGGSGKAGSGTGEDRSGGLIFTAFAKIVNDILAKIRDNIPGAGLMKDIAVESGKKAFGLVLDWAKGKLGSVKDIAEGVWNGIKGFIPGLSATAPEGAGVLNDSGGVLPTGRSVIRNDSGRPEAILSNIQWRHVVALIAVANQMTEQVGAAFDAAVPAGLGFNTGNLLGAVPSSATAILPDTVGSSRVVSTENGGPQYYVDKLIVNNPVPERASDSLPKQIRGLASIGPRKG